MSDCFPAQYKFLYYDEPCFLKDRTVCGGTQAKGENVWTDGKNNPSCVLFSTLEKQCHIKASFRPSYCPYVHPCFFIFVDTQTAVWTEREDKVCRSKGPVTLFMLARWKGRRREGKCGDFCQKHERAFVPGGIERSEDWLFVMYLQRDLWIFD